MPADESLSQETTSATHGDGVSPYKCSTAEKPPRAAAWSIDYGYCRTSLDHQPPKFKQGSTDPRCPRGCQHKAPERVARKFMEIFAVSGAKKAAEYSRCHRDNAA